MKKLLLTLIAFSFLHGIAFSQIFYEDFEGSPREWNPFGDGVFNGVVENPDTNFINNSMNVGSYTKSDQHAFSLLITVLDAPVDLSVNNQFSIDVYSPVATQILFKLEGTGEAVEATKNIANINVWQTYTFDFSSAAGFTTIDKIIIFFDPGVMESGDTYLFDNIVANPAGPCAGTVPDPLIIDDYECQRNASYGAGWDVLTPVANPDPSGINTSSTVAEYVDPPGAFSAFVIDYNSAIDLSTNSVIKVKIWSPKGGQVLIKLEGGVSPPAELFLDVPEPNTWVEYVADFSDQSNANHEAIAIFTNAGVEPEEGDTYYIDDIVFAEPEPEAALEDFEDGLSLGWEPLNGDMNTHGMFSGPIANPDATAPNESPNIGQYTKGNAAFSTLSAFLPNGLDLSGNPQLNLQVWAPDGATEVTLQLASPTQGNKDVTRAISATMQWIDLEFNFEEFATITDFERVNVLFDPGTAAPGTVYFLDNLAQGQSTVDPCEGVAPIANIVDDFECQRNGTYTAGTDQLSVIPNPDVSEENSSTTVGQYVDPFDEFSALVFQQGSSLDLQVQNQFHIKVWSPAIVPLGFKLEGGSSAPIEIVVEVTEANKWIEYVVDFSDQANEDHAQMAIFFNFAQVQAEELTYFIDDMFWTRASYSGCATDYETVPSSISNFQYFANGALEAQGKQFEVLDNPNPTGINTSDKVGEFIKAGDGQSFAGMFANLDAPIDFGENKTARAKVHMDHIGNFAIKLEGSTTGAAPIEIPIENTVVNDWEELTYDFSGVADDADYRRLTVFFDLGIDATGEDVVSYFDDIVFGDGDCPLLSTSLFEPIVVETFQVSPNPTTNQLFIENTLDVDRLLIMNAVGQVVKTVRLINVDNTTLDVSSLDRGMYLMAGYNEFGELIANAKFIKH